MRKLIYFSLFVLLSFTCLADLGIQNSESVTTDVTRYIRINSGTDFTNYTIDVRWTDQVWCYQETANGTNDCWGLDTGSYYANTSDGITDPKQWDEIWWYNDLGSGEFNTTFLVNYTVPVDTLSVKYNYLFGSCIGIQGDDDPTVSGCASQIELPFSCFNDSKVQINFTAIEQELSYRYDHYGSCYNGTGWYEFYYYDDAYSSSLSEEAIWWGKKSNYSVDITFADSVLWSGDVYTSLSWWTTGDFSDQLETFDYQTCDCVGCYKEDLDCFAPLVFTFEPEGYELTYNLTDDLFIYTAGGFSLAPGHIGDSVNLPSLNDVWDTVSSGASLGVVLESWNPDVYGSMVASFEDLFVGGSLDDLGDKLYNVFRYFFKYILRSPASLVATGGLQ